MLLTMGISVGIAQNANRSGVFVELAGGIPIGDIYGNGYVDGYIYDYSLNNQYIDVAAPNMYLKGGVELYFSVGYRYALNENWAVGLQAGIEGNVDAFEETFKVPKGMLGVRWTSGDFKNGMSFYIQPQAGFALNIKNSGIYVPAGVDLGFNLTNHMYLGFDLTYNISVGGDYIGKPVYTDKYEDYWASIVMDPKSYMSAKIKLGYRF